MTANDETAICANCHLEFSGDALFCPNCGTAKARDFEGDPLLGTRVGERFLIIERIGHGASGTIYRAEHVTLRRKVAVKVLHHELSRDDLAIERFRREATTVGEIDNDHIVEIFDFGRIDDGRLFLAMELLEGETLDGVLKRERRLDIERAVDVLIQLGEALMEAHAMGYIHRDLRPRNIYLAVRRGRPNFVKLLDFGLAKLVEHEGEAASTSLGMTFGEPKYMSPEQARGDPVDRRADIYSMGCIAYEMLTGAPPFTGGKVFDILSRHVDSPHTPVKSRRPDVPDWLDVAVNRMLAKDPNQRFTTVYRLVEALREGLETGATMSDEKARRRETEPPPSVVRALAKAEREELARAAAEAEQAAAEPTAGDAVPRPADPRDTERDSERIERRLAGESPDQEDDEDLRKTTRREVDRDELQARARASGKRTPSGGSSAGISAAWYADGDNLDGESELDDSMQAKLARARGAISPSGTGVVDEYYFEERRRWPIVAVVIAATIALIVGIVLAWPKSKSRQRQSAAPADAAVVAMAPAIDAGVPADAVPAPIDAKARPARETAPTKPDRPPRETPPRETPPRETPPRETPPRETPPRDTPPDETPPDETPPDETPPHETPGDSSSSKAKEAEFFAKMGDKDLRNGDILGAAGNFNKARDLDPKNVDAVVGLGEIALTQSSYSAAIGHLKSAARMRPRSARIHTLLGEAYLGDGNNSQAAASFKKALKIDPDYARARDGYNEATGSE